MILSIPKSSGKIKHIDNIAEIHNNQSGILNLLQEFDPMYAGGYPMALLFAPRTLGNSQIKPGYYHDYDLYFPDNDSLGSATSLLNSKLETIPGSAYETENAITYNFEPLDQTPVQIQVVKIRHGSPSDILKTFDFKNCAIGYSPLSQTVHLHAHAPKLHVDRKLDILEPWMLEDIGNVVEANAIVQLMRFKKYCLRWNYSLSKHSFDKLYSLYKERPDIKIQANQTYLVHDGPYNRQTFIGLQNQNVWKAIAPIMMDNEYWSDSLDVHNLIKMSSNDLTYDEALIETQTNQTNATNQETIVEHNIPF